MHDIDMRASVGTNVLTLSEEIYLKAVV